MSISTRTRSVRSCSCTAGRVSGQVGSIKSRNSEWVVLYFSTFRHFVMQLTEGLPFDRPQHPWVRAINASGGRPVLWLIPRLGWGRTVYLGARRCFANHRDRASCHFSSGSHLMADSQLRLVTTGALSLRSKPHENAPMSSLR